ncbi:hypothetical protein IMG5_124970 [Ichthyophthirius multifiliis]|uniref:HYDIN/VesB/CFA65-like Ig-like domain-containing protein n=1 Tax=Ichthyophthirius multifiliis TaxID=5932 RepID=G0QVP3_ICHMU|nr:hypothetical protein IMG5_124970 [Ichthyophthirius multifiliis]EGR30730.1 hypothetical protein IMG5_124970 [Ichthyophthirius multifiliis]|eukprot:XP_004032317.1 hypothetical protein IMG5_124970 [Ichthyophthirius multifiliis]
MKEKIFKLRNKDKVARRVKIIQPDSRLFQVIPALSNQSLGQSQISNQKQTETEKKYIGNKIAPGMEASFIIKFSPEAKIDYHYDLIVVTEREEFIIPIYAIGKRAMIEFPDILDFGQCPVKYLTEKPIIIRNVGEKATKWSLTLPSEFEVDKKEGVLEYEKNEQIVLKFFPKETQLYKNKGILEYDNLKAFFSLKADVQNHLVYFSTNSISLEESYIGLRSQGTVKIFNKSPVKIDFEWRTFQSENEEMEKKGRLRLQLEEEEAEEKMLLKEIVNNEKIQDEEMEFMDNEGDSEDDQEDEKTIIEKIQKKANLMLTRKYKDIHKAIDDDLLLFQDDIFSIQPISGSIWPNSEITITVTFSPQGQHSYRTFAYCNISCKQQRLELELQGDGIGPKAELNQNEINLGDPYVNEEVNLIINIENKGDIDCKFDLLPNERHFGKMFKFFPENGLLKVSEKKDIKITFCSSKPGEFKETFKWRLHGSNDFLQVLFIGHIRAPQFEFDKEYIDFGKVSFNFPQEQRLKLTNKSTVPFDYVLRIPGENGHEKEFTIEKSQGNIKSGETIENVIVFIPKYTKSYDMVLTIDIKGVAQDMKCLSIKAESEVPQVEIIPQDKLDFGEIFLKHSDVKEVQLINNSLLKAKFEVQEQKKESMIIAKYEAFPPSGIIQPGKETTIKIKLTTNTLGDISLPLGIIIIGSNNNLPYFINIAASSIGPKVEAQNSIKEIDLDQQMFYKTIFRKLQQLINLQFKLTLELYKEQKDGTDIDIVLKAKGIGKTIFCDMDLSLLDFQTVYTFKKHIIEVFIQNKGRKQQKLTWVRRAEKKKAVEDNLKKSSLIDNNNQTAEETVFSIVPDNVVLPAKHGIIFQFRGYSTKSGLIPEQFVLNTIVGNERKSYEVYSTTIQGDFIKPSLKFSEKRTSSQRYY